MSCSKGDSPTPDDARASCSKRELLDFKSLLVENPHQPARAEHRGLVVLLAPVAEEVVVGSKVDRHDDVGSMVFAEDPHPITHAVV